MTLDVERITESEAAYTAELAEQVKAAQSSWSSWSSFLARRYRLGADDSIGEDGVIRRAEAEAAP